MKTDQLKGALGILVCVDDDGLIHNGRVLRRADDARGYAADAVIWLREPTREDREAALPTLFMRLGIERHAYGLPQ